LPKGTGPARTGADANRPSVGTAIAVAETLTEESGCARCSAKRSIRREPTTDLQSWIRNDGAGAPGVGLGAHGTDVTGQSRSTRARLWISKILFGAARSVIDSDARGVLLGRE